MKKLLMGLLALSAVSFAASNPGDNATTAASKAAAEVGVPMEVRVNLLPQEGRLVLVDENNKLIDKLIFDHGDIIMGAATTDSKIEKEVRLRRDDNQAFGGAYKAQFTAKDAAGTKVASGNDFILNGHGAASGKQIKSKLVYRENEITTGSSDVEVMTKVQSIIPATELNDTSNKVAGLYVGTGTFEATMKQ